MHLPRIGITPGDPAGIGPDICLQVFQEFESEAELVFYTNPGLMTARARKLGLEVTIHGESKRGGLQIHSVDLQSIPEPGVPDATSAPFVIDCLGAALEACQDNHIDAIVTGPVNKSLINQAGIPFTGHTEWFAAETNTAQPVMLLASDDLRIAIATTHLPLRKVADAIKPKLLRDTLTIMHNELIDKFAIRKPVISVCGLNPHAGENGQLGNEETDTIVPTLESLRKEGMKLIGPVPADTVFTKRSLAQVDAVLAMYHDQGLSVLKHAAFGDAVNITLGLPMIRTSVDHGTAYDLAGSGDADPGSLIAAIRCAINMIDTK